MTRTLKQVVSVVVPLALIFLSPAHTEEDEKRGVYFAKKNFAGTPIPSYAAVRDKLPSPILADNAEHVELYWKAWELAFNNFRRPPTGSPLVSNFIDEGFAPQIFQWDTIFMMMFARYAHHLFPAIESLDNFYCRQHDNGYICREIFEADGKDYYYEGVDNTINPPLFAWAELEWYRLSGNTSRFAIVLPVLEKYAEWLETGRKKAGTQHGLFWNTGLGSGMDNTPRSGSGWVDMSAQTVMMYNNLGTIADELGLPEKANHFRLRARDVGEKINRFMWNEDDGLYYDVDDEGHHVKVKAISCFWPMLAGVSSPHQVEKMITNLKDPKTFWRHNVFPSLAADHEQYRADGEYWLGAVWSPTNVAVIKGLDEYPHVGGASELARAASERYLDRIYAVFKKTGTIWENYAPESDMPGSPARPNFVGWSGCGPIQLLIENVLGFRPDAAHSQLTWRPMRTDKHGIEKLRFGTIEASLLCDPRRDTRAPVSFTVKANEAFTLIVLHPKGSRSFRIAKGTTRLHTP